MQNDNLRRIERFPEDFMFQLTDDEWDSLRSQFATANINISKVRFLPYAFTEFSTFRVFEVTNCDLKCGHTVSPVSRETWQHKHSVAV